jgi:predicted nuclease of predicted toxin-antitoxin system
MRGAADSDIWALARRADFVIVSKDDDFRSMALVHGAPPKVVWIQAGNAATAGIA